MNRIELIMIMIVLLLIAAVGNTNANVSFDQKAVIEGRVSTNQLVYVGQNVIEGTPLVNVETIVGNVPTARANTDGKVIAVYVKVGDVVKPNDIVAKIETK
jgi:biotin carboxyl carrier protein